MYKIIGADQKEYGPISNEQLRRWVIEGRLNAQTQARAEGETEWKPLSEFAEFADVLRTLPAASTSSASGSGGVPPEAVLSRDYSLDIGYCLARSWELIKRNFWPVVGISCLIMIISFAINQVLGLASRPVFKDIFQEHRATPGGIAIVLGTSLLGSPIYTLLMGGLFKYYLKIIRAENATIGDAFSGFSPAAGQLILLGLVNGFLTTLAYMLCILPGIYVSVAWIFALPLVIDRNLPFWDAMELSRKMVTKHWFIVFAFLLVMGLVTMCGIFACCLGIFVTVPIASVAILYAYEDIFGSKAA
jgi:hypothetical protein